MSISTPNLSSKKIGEYRNTAILRQKTRTRKIQARMKNGWKFARKAAKALREKYQAERVVVFGSLLNENCFTEWSDVDIAAWGISPEMTLRAIGTIADLTSALEINLVDINTCPAKLRKTIEQEGVDL